MRALLIVAGCAAILLPEWLPNRPSVPIEHGTVEMIQALLDSMELLFCSSLVAKAYFFKFHKRTPPPYPHLFKYQFPFFPHHLKKLLVSVQV